MLEFMQWCMHEVLNTVKNHKWHQRKKTLNLIYGNNVENKNEAFDIYDDGDIKNN